MASGLGVTVDPAGETGSGALSAPAQAEVIPDNPSTIVQSTAIQTLDQLLHDNWILDSTFTVSTSMPPGTIVHIKPIHPSKWNWPNQIVSKMFNIWTGSGKIRYRPLATAWYGGSIRVGFLPPNITESEIRNMPISVLTSYPNRDIDPKNTDWVDFRGPDQRAIAYHYMAPLDTSKPENFGGYIVFYVAGRLITQSPEFTTIQFITETAGDFMYDQPSPRALEPSPTTDDPLNTAASLDVSLHSLVDTNSTGDFNYIQICKSDIASIPNFGYTTSAVGRKIPIDVPGIGIADQSFYTSNRAKPSAGMIYKAIENQQKAGPLDSATRMVSSQEIVGRFFSAISNTSLTPKTFESVKMTGVSPDNTFTTDMHVEETVLNGTWPQAMHCNLRTERSSTTPIVLGDSPAMGMSAMANAGGESIVLFVNTLERTFSIQTQQIASKLAEWPSDESLGQTSWLYNVVSPAGVPLLTVRLNPNGVFSTNASNADILFPGTSSLTFIGTLPVTSPLPPLTTMARTARYELARALRHGVEEQEYKLLYNSL